MSYQINVTKNDNWFPLIKINKMHANKFDLKKDFQFGSLKVILLPCFSCYWDSILLNQYLKKIEFLY